MLLLLLQHKVNKCKNKKKTLIKQERKKVTWFYPFGLDWWNLMRLWNVYFPVFLYDYCVCCSCGRPYSKLRHGDGSIDAGDRTQQSGTAAESAFRCVSLMIHFAVVICDITAGSWIESEFICNWCLYESFRAVGLLQREMWREVWSGFFNNVADEPLMMSSDYDRTIETNHSDSSNFAQNEEDREGHRKACGTFPLTTLIPPEVQ